MPRLAELFADAHRTAFTTGIRSVQLRSHPSGPFKTRREWREFITACHRGYDRAQRLLVSTIADLASLDDPWFGELVLRNIADGIAHTMLRVQTHVVRRLSLHDEAQRTNDVVLRATLRDAERLNSESRLTFALLSDLTTFVHVGDILRVDHRQRDGRFSLIECKSGTVNEKLSATLGSYGPSVESLEQLDDDPNIAEQHRAQAKRMMRQRIRMHQVEEVLRTDSGTDIALGSPIRLVGPTVQTVSYDEFLVDICQSAQEDGVCAGCVQGTLHVGAASSATPGDAIRLARGAASASVTSLWKTPDPDLAAVGSETAEMIRKGDRWCGYDLLRTNVMNNTCRPFTLWMLGEDLLVDLVAGRLAVCVCFDLAGFVWLGRQLGFDISFASRRESERLAQELGGREVPRWSDRALVLRHGDAVGTLGGGLLVRLLCDLTSPGECWRLLYRAVAEAR
jgi:hypothetical protein